MMFERYFPLTIAATLDSFSNIEEIRIREGKKLSVVDKLGINELDFYVTNKFIKDFFSAVCSYSVYALTEEIKNGYITLPQGHRIGFCGRCITENGEIKSITDITGINIRIAREIIGCSDEIFKLFNKEIKNTVIVSPPNCGKTTYLRDLIRNYSDDFNMVSVVDERGEIAPYFEGSSVFNLGKNTDVLRFCPKCRGMMLMLRTMNPKIIATDEIGTNNDATAIYEILNSGVKIFTTFHGFGISDLKKRFRGWDVFDYAVLLNQKKETEEIVCLK